MPYKEIHCIVVSCDRCGEEYAEDYVPHYPTREAAEEAVCDAGWDVHEGRVLCEACSQRVKED